MKYKKHIRDLKNYFDKTKLYFKKIGKNAWKAIKVLMPFFAFFKKSKIKDQEKLQADFDQKLVLSLSKSRIPKFKQLKHIGKYLSRPEKILLFSSVIVIIISSIFLGTRFVFTHLETVPKQSGTYTEGLVGAPKYINPLYSQLSDVDSDISHLVYSSLFARDSNGNLEQDLIEEYSISDDKKTYSFRIKENVKWHNGTTLTANDVYFTFNAIKDPMYKSSLRSGFSGVNIEVVDDYNFKFILSNPYAAFFELLTFGIMPADLWSLVPPESASLAELNLKPIGSGPYKYEQLAKEKKLGTIKEYTLAVNEDYYGEIPYIAVNFKFFNDFTEALNALNNNEVDGISYLPLELKSQILTPKSLSFYKLLMPQLTVVFFNQKSNPALGDKDLRQALSYAISKNDIINNILEGEAYAVNGPILPNSFAYYNEIKKYDYNLPEAEKLLDKIDWKLEEISEEDVARAEEDILSEDEEVRKTAEKILRVGVGKWRKKNDEYLLIRLTTVDRGENQAVVENLKIFWEAIGVKTNIEIVPASQIQVKIIKPRDYEAFFYGQVLGADPDPYSFWHSSQANEQGLNIANYSNKEVDKLLEDARLSNDEKFRQEKYREFQEIIAEEVPAIFMYSPMYNYVQNHNLKGFKVENVVVPSDRFANIAEWYLETEKKIVF
jgi:peptide/nickel transport system substrate-binding protein